MSEIVDMLRSSADDMEMNPCITQRFSPKFLRGLADRIDAEMVELPRGKDGRPIHVGDTVYDEFPDALTVNSITLSDCYARVKASGKRAVYDGLDPERLTHERPDSLERIDSEMVELPKDADGMPIHVGDTVWDVEDGMKFVVKSVTLYAGGVTKVDAVCDGCHAHVSPDSFSHTRPDSFERIADELKRYANDSYSEDEIDGMTASTLVDLADRIRKLAAKEDK